MGRITTYHDNKVDLSFKLMLIINICALVLSRGISAKIRETGKYFI